MTDIKAILFDVFGTVVDWRGSLIRELSAWGDERGWRVDWEGLADAWRGAYVPSMNRVRRGELPWMNLDELQRRSLAGIGARFGLPRLDDADREHIVTAWHRLDPWPDSVTGLARLKRALHDCAAVERQCRVAGQHGQARRAAVGHGVRHGIVPSLQARSRNLSGRRRGCLVCTRTKR